MQIVHAYRHPRHLESFSHPISPLSRTLYVDGFIYFAVIVTLRLWSSLMVRQIFIAKPITLPAL